jgi:hypothetical protein
MKRNDVFIIATEQNTLLLTQKYGVYLIPSTHFSRI